MSILTWESTWHSRGGPATCRSPSSTMEDSEGNNSHSSQEWHLSQPQACCRTLHRSWVSWRRLASAPSANGRIGAKLPGSGPSNRG